MKTFLVFIGLFLTILYVHAYNPFIDGALAPIEVCVVDDLGECVSNADISVSFAIDIDKSITKKGKTDLEGKFFAQHKTTGSIWILIEKEGYYTTRFQTTFSNLFEEIVKTRKWTDKTVQVSAILKKKRNPAKLILHGGTFQQLKYPATNEVIGLDLQKFDWCPPYGNGQYDDLQIKYEFWRSSTNWFQVYSHLSITMTNGLDGVYFAQTDDFSKMNRCYFADTNAVYQKSLEFVYDRKTENVDRNIEMPRDKYMIFRTRTKSNEKGELVSANYGLIFEKSEYGIKLNMRTAFNPETNDTNLELEGGWR